MHVVAEAEHILMSQPLRARGEFAARLLASLRPADADEDAIVAEALRRSEELKRDPSLAVSLDELDRRMQERFGWKYASFDQIGSMRDHEVMEFRPFS